ncbi:hypothetical protein [Bordetella genomosp. 1]|uniref:Uncharacterized protein n=1 Tax=Bordetella genomosp. 1 TaxID=1395607 RepID=A0ABX4EUD1_9BORD|nr:hypothetical protein [Bordetella genomosp. 1]OZI57840.1 hypothetical protein CAL27_20785 [Bordetella genomosp. 1]
MWQGMVDEAAWLHQVNADPEARLIGRYTDTSFEIVSGKLAAAYRLEAGVLSPLYGKARAAMVFSAPAVAWAAFLAPVPFPPNQHFLGMERRRSDFSIAHGRPAYIRHLRVLTRVFELARSCAYPAALAPEVA